MRALVNARAALDISDGLIPASAHASAVWRKPGPAGIVFHDSARPRTEINEKRRAKLHVQAQRYWDPPQCLVLFGMANRIVHFEIEAADRDRATKFYSQAFGWQMDQMDEEMGNYVVVITGDPKEPGGINGGIFMTPPGAKKELNAFSCVVAVDNIDQAMANVKSAGGQLLSDKMDIPMVGTYVRCKDTEGNIFTMLQATPGST